MPDEIVETFSDNIRKTIASAVDDTIEHFRRMLARWVAGAIVGAALVAAGMVWLFVPAPSRQVTEWSIHHADGLVETCALVPDGGEGAPRFACRTLPSLVTPPPAPTPVPLAPQQGPQGAPGSSWGHPRDIPA